jgi:hypothetical protein
LAVDDADEDDDDETDEIAEETDEDEWVPFVVVKWLLELQLGGVVVAEFSFKN